MRNKMSRRDMMKMMGALGGGAFLGASGLLHPSLARAQSDVSGAFTHWRVPPETPLELEQWSAFEAAFTSELSNIDINVEFFGYAEMLDKLRVAVRGGGGPNVAVLPIMWGVEFAANGFLHPLSPEDVGYSSDQFWPKAMNSVRWEGGTYGVPTNNETMAFIYNKSIFEQAGLDPERGPETWEEVAEFSRQIKANTGINGFGMVARLNHGNTPFRFMPVLWAYGGSVLDELEDNPEFTEVRINSDETRAALQLYYDMYVTDQSVPLSALDNSQTENRELFIAEQVAMMISHPVEYSVITDVRPDMADSVNYILYPEGPERRAAVFGGSNIHIMNNIPEEDLEAAHEFVRLRCNPEWSNRLAWFSNPGNRDGFENEWFQTRTEEIPFLDVATEMLQYGVSFPIIPESTEILNLIVPTMIHNVLTEAMSIDEAVVDAETKILEVMERA